MDTIKERAEANWVVEDDYNGKVIRGWLIDAYILGATEQEPITRKATIEKAKKAFCDTCMGQCKDKSHCDTLQKFTYALEG